MARRHLLPSRVCRATAARVAAAMLLAAAVATALAQPLTPGSPGSATPVPATRTTSLPSRGLFVGDQLSPAARARLAEFIVDAIGHRIEVALIVPVGPWDTEGSGRDERDLTPARLQSVRRFLTERGVESKRIFVESRIDPNAKDARLDIQTVSRPAND